MTNDQRPTTDLGAWLKRPSAMAIVVSWPYRIGSACNARRLPPRESLRRLRFIHRRHAAEPRIHILITRLKPVTEGRPQHALRGARRTAFEHVMLPIEKIRRIARIKRKRLEAGQRVE